MQCKNFILPWKWMNSPINKTFYTCSTESLLLRYKKISKKALNLGSVQYIYFYDIMGVSENLI